jgi:Cu+-exporting ATPase
MPETTRDESLPCASFSVIGETSVSNLRSLKKRLYSLRGVQHVELIPLSKMVEVSFRESVTSGSFIAQSAAGPFDSNGCALSLLNTTGLKSQQQQFEISLEITGMSCAACVVKVERALRATTGVEHVTVNLATKRAAITFDSSGESCKSAEDLATVVIKLGFKARVANEELSTEALQKSQDHEVNQWKTLLVLSLLLIKFDTTSSRDQIGHPTCYVAYDATRRIRVGYPR